jgi:hypothetical protein
MNDLERRVQRLEAKFDIANIKSLDVAGVINTTAGFTISGVPVGTSTDTYWNPEAAGIYYAAGKVRIGNASIHDTGTRNFAAGKDALAAITTGVNNIAIGENALLLNTTGDSNVAIGVSALHNNIDGSYNIAIGDGALVANISGDNNTVVGIEAMDLNTTGYGNTAFGRSTLAHNLIGYNNTAVGNNALHTSTGVGNTAYGMTSLYENTSGNENTACGSSALYTNTTGSNNVAVGNQALYLASTVSGCVALGNWAGGRETASNKFFVDNQDRTSEALGRSMSLIYGVFDAAVANQELRFNAGKMGFFGHAAAAQPAKASHNNWAALSDVVAALVAIGIFDTA